jgi:hypothetical protein
VVEIAAGVRDRSCVGGQGYQSCSSMLETQRWYDDGDDDSVRESGRTRETNEQRRNLDRLAVVDLVEEGLRSCQSRPRDECRLHWQKYPEVR